MLGGWSSTIDPIQLADSGAHLTGELPLAGLQRLIEVCSDAQGSVSVDLHFTRDPTGGLRALQGRITAHVGLTCQRCMQRFETELTSEPHLLLLRLGERDDLVEQSDALVIEQPMTLGDLVEVELLLEVPMVPMHPADLCPAQVVAAAPVVQRKEAGETSPFSVLEQLKRRDR